MLAKKLSNMSEQEIFDKVSLHLLKQNAISVDPNVGETHFFVCRYRGLGGRKCAIGCLIDDDEYDPSIEEGESMICAYLENATEEEIFEKVARHLLQQGQMSVDAESGQCQYRGEGGMMCAAGCLIPEEEYTPELEGESWYTLAARNAVCRNRSSFIEQLQQIHDRGFLFASQGHETIRDYWRASLRALGESSNFSQQFLDQILKEVTNVS